MSDLASTEPARTDPNPTDLAQRYGAPGRVRRSLLIGMGAAIGTAAMAWLVWAMLSYARPLTSSEQIAFDVVDQHTAEATVTVVRRNAEVKASCLLRALAADHSIVGELSFPVGPSQPATTTLTKTVRTEREATSVFMVGCVANGQTRPR